VPVFDDEYFSLRDDTSPALNDEVFGEGVEEVVI